ncbi:hypothetical protein WMY93_002308 [Mugilogobius chulae]|uniref:Galectin n=1 Tax=Mugilogobius chulae TaxID=88201 RepID=A0AAW0Q438_9GOBI
MSFKVGQTMTLVGKAKPDASNFAVNIGPDETDITMHMNPRFDAHGDQNTVVCNSYQGGTGISITFNPAEFLVVLTDGSSFTFPNRMAKEKYSVVNVDGDARITSIEIK